MWKFLNGTWMLFAPENEGGATEEPDAEEPEDEPEPDAEEPEDEPEPDAEEPEGEPDPALSRKETRVQRLANEARTEREARIRAEERARLLEEERNRRPAQSDNGEAARLRAEKMSLMTSEEKERFLDREELAKLRNEQEIGNIRSYDFADKADYNAIAAQNTTEGKLYAKNKDRVEQTLMSERSKGRNPTRAGILRILLGDDLLKSKPGKQVLQKKKEAAGRVEASKSKPLSARGDVGGGKGGKEETLEQMRERIISREKAEGRG